MELLRSLQLSGKKREGGLYWPGSQQLPVHTPQITMETYISDWIHKFQNKTGLDAKSNSELSKRVCSATRQVGSFFENEYLREFEAKIGAARKIV
jgi:hypothetical protein